MPRTLQDQALSRYRARQVVALGMAGKSHRGKMMDLAHKSKRTVATLGEFKALKPKTRARADLAHYDDGPTALRRAYMLAAIKDDMKERGHVFIKAPRKPRPYVPRPKRVVYGPETSAMARWRASEAAAAAPAARAAKRKRGGVARDLRNLLN